MHKIAFLVAALGTTVLLAAPARASDSLHTAGQQQFFEDLVYKTYVTNDPTDKVEYRDVWWRHHAYYGGYGGSGYAYPYRGYYWGGYAPYYGYGYGYQPNCGNCYYGW